MKRFLGRASVLVVAVAVVLGLVGRAEDKTTLDKAWLLSDSLYHDADVWFMGSSRVFRQFDPVTFDSVMAAHGHPVTSINLGTPAMFPLEQSYNLEYLLRHSDAWPDQVVLGIEAIILVEAEETRRMQQVHDWTRYMMAMRVLWNTLAEWGTELEPWQAPLRVTLDRIKTRTKLLAAHYTNIGDGPTLAKQAIKAAAPSDLSDPRRRALTQGRGFLSLDGEVRLKQTGTRYDERRAEFLRPEEQAEFQSRVTRAEQNAEDDTVLPPHVDVARVYERMIRQCQEQGIGVVVVVPPGIDYGSSVVRAMRERGIEVPIVRLDIPSEHPALFDANRWFDVGHLGEEAAQEATRLLAEQVARH